MPRWIIPCASNLDLAGMQAESMSVLDIKNHFTFFFSLFSISFVIPAAYTLPALIMPDQQRVQNPPPQVPEIRLHGIRVKTLLKYHLYSCHKQSNTLQQRANTTLMYNLYLRSPPTNTSSTLLSIPPLTRNVPTPTRLRLPTFSTPIYLHLGAYSLYFYSHPA